MTPLPPKKRPSSQQSSKYSSPPKSPQKSPLKKSPMKSPVKEHPANMIDQRKHMQHPQHPQQQSKRLKRTSYANSRGLEESEDSDAMDVNVEEIGTGEKTLSFTAVNALGLNKISSHQQEKQHKMALEHKHYSVKPVSALASSAPKKQQLPHNLQSPQMAQYSKIDNKTNSNSKNSAQHINAPLSLLSSNKTAIDGNETVCGSDPFNFGESSKMNLSAAKKDYVSKSKRKDSVASSTGSIGQRPPISERKAPYVHAATLIEAHRAPVYAVAFNQFVKYGAAKHFFATVGTNRISIYSCISESVNIKTASANNVNNNGNANAIRLVRHFEDPDASDEHFYAVTWAYYGGDIKAHAIVVGGQRGIIRVLAPHNGAMYCCLTGHGNAINELRTSPTNPMIIASASRDMTARLWNIQRSECLAILGGAMGHRDQVLSLDFNRDGTYLATASMDHAVKLWSIGPDTETGRNIEESMNSLYANSRTNIRRINTAEEHFPVAKSRDLHTNYVDCVRILGDFIVSKSCENQIALWKFGGFGTDQNGIAGIRTSNSNEPIETFSAQTAFMSLPNSPAWFNKFAIDPFNEFIACGNQSGEVHIWRLQKEQFDLPSEDCDYMIPSHHIRACTRQVAFSPDSSIMIVVAGEGVVARFDLRREERERIDTKLKADVAEAAEKLRLASMSSPRKHGALKSPLKSPRKLPSQSPRPTSSRADERNSGSIKLTKPNFVSKSPKTSTVSGKFAEQPSLTASTKQMRHASTLPVKKQQQTSPQQQLSKSPRTPTRSSISSGKNSPTKTSKQTNAGHSASSASSSSARSMATRSTPTTPTSGGSRKQQPTVKTSAFGAGASNLTPTKRGN